MKDPKRIGKYEILKEIGRGGFAAVYRARDTELDRVVALKVLYPQLTPDPKFIQRFHQEARVAAGLNHPHIVTIHEVGEEGEQYYLAMTFLPGRTLDKRLAEGPLPLEEAVSIVEQVAGALDAIHGQGLVHRDVKPGNIMVDDVGQATLLDFGIVRAAEGTRLTTTMVVLGTPEYMAPEQAELEEAAGIDWRADVYALGVVAYEMLVGRPPFAGRSPTAVLYKHIHEPPPAPTVLNADLPAGLEPILLQALAKERGARFQQAGAFAAELRRTALAERRAREREVELAQLYERLQAAVTEEDWAGVLALGGQICTLVPDYRDVAQLMAQAREQLRRPKRRPVPAGARRAVVGGAILVLLLGLGIPLALGVFRARPLPTGAPTQQPTEVPAAVSGAPAGQPTAVSAAALATAPTEPPAEMPTQAPTEELSKEPTLPPGVTWTRPADGMVMVHVPAGTFQMGSSESDPNAEGDEFPQHSVTLDALWIDRTEVTNAQYRRCVEAGACQAPTKCDWGSPNYGEDKKANHPVLCVDWHGAAAYCEWAGGRLPTEAEWEYAARGPDSFIYPWGNDLPDATLLNYAENVGDTSQVGSYSDGASWCGALDMAGNLWEWVADWYDIYSSAA